MKYLEKSYLVSTFLFPLPHNMHLFDDCDDTSSCWIQTALSSEKSLQWLIFIFAIIDSRGLTNNCLDFFFLPCVVAQKINLEMNRERWVLVKKKCFFDIKQAAGFPFPSRALELISTLVEGIFNMSAPLQGCSTLLISGSYMSFLRSLPLLRKLLWGTEALIDWRLSPQDASIIIISTSAEGRGSMSRGSGRKPLLCVPDSQLEAALCQRRVGCRVNCRGPNSWLYQGPLCLQQLSRQLRPGCNRWLISLVPDDTSISTRQVLFRTWSCLWLSPAYPSFYSKLRDADSIC